MPRIECAPRAQGVKYQLGQIPGGEAGTDATVSTMGGLVNQAIANQRVRLVALKILQSYGVPNHNQAAEARALFNYVQSRIRYVRDPIELETVQAPEVTLKLRAGDCDDHSALMVALAKSIAIPARFAVVGKNRNRFAHIYPELLINGHWLAADTTRQGVPFGTPAPRLGAVKLYSAGGKPMYYGLGENQKTGTRAVPVPKEVLQQWAYRGAMKAMRGNWNNGTIDRDDLKSYLVTIDQGNGPGRFTFAEAPMRQAIVDMLKETAGKSSGKTGLSGLEGLDGFLGSVWSGVKKAVGAGVKLVTGGGSPTVTVQPPTVNVTVPEFRSDITPASAQAGVGAILSHPVTMVALGVAGLLVATSIFKK